MPTEMGDLLSKGTLYFQDEDGNMTPFMGFAEAALLGCTEGTIDFVDGIPVIREMTFTAHVKQPTRAQLRALGLTMKRRSRRAIGRPIKRMKRLKEKYRRCILKNGIDKKIIANCKKYMEERCDEEFSH